MDNIEEKLLSEYMADLYPGCGDDMRESIRNTVGFRIHVLGYYHKELSDAILSSMRKTQEEFIKKFLGPSGDA